MAFNGKLNYAGESGRDRPQLGIPATIRDARVDGYVVESPQDSTELLLDGAGFLLVRTPSSVNDWSDPSEVADTYYAESRAMVQALLPAFKVKSITSHTFRNEDIKDHHWVDGIQYGPCATFVHNDYADDVTDDHHRLHSPKRQTASPIPR